MARCQLTDQQKDLIRSLVPGLKDGSVDSEWSYIPEIGGTAEILGLPQTLRDTDWKSVTKADLDDFIECEFLRYKGKGSSGFADVYTLHKQRIIDAVKNNFGEQKYNMTETPSADNKTIFVVHGRNNTLRRDFFSFLRALGLSPLEWEECIKRTNKASPYIGEILDIAFSQAQAVIVLLTPDDLAQLRSVYQTPSDGAHEINLTGQARPNVLFEAGMAMGRNPNRTLLIEIGNLRPFSDTIGRMKINFDGSAESRNQVVQRLRTANCNVEPSGHDWLSIGTFTSASVAIAPEEYPANIWGKGGNIWRLHGDLIALFNAVSNGRKTYISDYAKHVAHHAIQVGFDDVAREIGTISSSLNNIPSNLWTNDTLTNFANQIESIGIRIGEIIEKRQPGFKPDPD